MPYADLAIRAWGRSGCALPLTPTPNWRHTRLMVEASSHKWRDICERCGHGFDPGESRWIEQRRFTVHTECADWSKWEQPPYSWKLRELRKEYRSADAQSRARIVQAGRAIRRAQAHWPKCAVEHVERVLEAVRGLG